MANLESLRKKMALNGLLRAAERSASAIVILPFGSDIFGPSLQSKPDPPGQAEGGGNCTTCKSGCSTGCNCCCGTGCESGCPTGCHDSCPTGGQGG
jgi:hypothetical protein